MNEFRFHDFTIMVDYAHNPHGLRAFGDFVKAVEATKKIGVITGVGDRRNEDIMALGEEAAKLFDEIIIRQDKDLRGRTAIEISSLLRSGIQKAAPHKKITYFPNELDATDYVVSSAIPGSFAFIFVDKVMDVCRRLQQYLNNEKKIQQKQIV